MTEQPAGGYVPAALDTAVIDIDGTLDDLVTRAEQARFFAIGFPGAVDIDYRPLLRKLDGRLWNNVGDPDTEPGGAAHTMQLERDVIGWTADLLGLPTYDRWGYTTTGGTEGNLAGLYAARRRFPDALFVYTPTAHYSVPSVVDILGVPAERVQPVGTTGDDEMDYQQLAAVATARRGRPLVVVATAGTTMLETVDDTDRIVQVLHDAGVRQHHIHVDAALGGFPLALDGSLRMDARSGIDSIAISGHKFFGTPVPCGLALMRASVRGPGQQVSYTATNHTTITGSRNGAAAAMLWYALASYRWDGHRQRVRAARELAAYTTRRLTGIGWPAYHHPRAFTVAIATPPRVITDNRWLLATDGPISHVICMPGISREQIDAFVDALAALRMDRQPAPQATARLPHPRAIPEAARPLDHLTGAP